MTIRILGIDPGYHKVGFGIIDINDDIASIVECGVIYTDSGLDISERLVEIADDIEDLIEEYDPDIAGLEHIYFTHNVSTAIHVAEARGVLMLVLERAGIDIVEMTPGEAKKAVCGRANADKKQVEQMVMRILDMSTPPAEDDASDGLAIAIYVGQRVPIR